MPSSLGVLVRFTGDITDRLHSVADVSAPWMLPATRRLRFGTLFSRNTASVLLSCDCFGVYVHEEHVSLCPEGHQMEVLDCLVPKKATTVEKGREPKAGAVYHPLCFI